MGDADILDNPLAAVAAGAAAAAGAAVKVVTGDSEPAAAKEDQAELELLPDFFGPVRPLLLRPDGTPRQLVRLAPAVHAFVWLGFSVHGVFKFSVGSDKSEVQVFEDVIRGFVFGAGASFLPLLAGAIRSDTGPLVQLGAGVRKVPRSQLRSLRLWRVLLAVPSAGVALFSFSILLYTLGQFGNFLDLTACPEETRAELNPAKVGLAGDRAGTECGANPLALAVGLPLFPILTLGWPAGCAWCED
eukprot:SAG22_NODE_26_length_29806_cov_19.885381_1_plen_245_part_00